MKKKTILLLISFMVLCQCVNSPSGKTPSEKDMLDVIAELDTLVNQFIMEKNMLFGETSYWESDTLNATCYKRALIAIAQKYGEESDEALACLQYVADSLLDLGSPLSRKTWLSYSCYEKALNISKKMYGDTSIAVGKCYADMVFASGQNSHDAQIYADSALSILVPKCGYSSEEVADVYWSLGDSYRMSNHGIYQVVIQSKMGTSNKYYSDDEYEEIMSNLEISLANYRKALNIYKEISEESMGEYVKDMELLREEIQITEDELKENFDGLAHLKKNPPKP